MIGPFAALFTSGSTLTVIRGAVNTRTGVWVESSRHDVGPCGVDPTGGMEVTGTQDTLTTDVTVYAPYNADVVPTDRAILDGDESTLYDVYGSPDNWANPSTGAGLGCVIRLVHHKG